MSELLTKLSTYNIFNYLLPGVLFAAFGTYITGYNLLLEDLLTGVFVYYFYGLVISRVGSLFLERLLLASGVIAHAPYPNYLDALSSDEKLATLNEQNNTYRTLASLFIVLLGLKALELLQLRFNIDFPEWLIISLVSLSAFLFTISYIKQSEYVKKRIDAASTN